MMKKNNIRGIVKVLKNEKKCRHMPDDILVNVWYCNGFIYATDRFSAVKIEQKLDGIKDNQYLTIEDLEFFVRNARSNIDIDWSIMPWHEAKSSYPNLDRLFDESNYGDGDDSRISLNGFSNLIVVNPELLITVCEILDDKGMKKPVPMVMSVNKQSPNFKALRFTVSCLKTTVLLVPMRSVQ
jgi:hypothetical protein